MYAGQMAVKTADSKRVQGLTGVTRTRSSRVHSYRLHTVCETNSLLAVG
jgi:hypothetical protein